MTGEQVTFANAERGGRRAASAVFPGPRISRLPEAGTVGIVLERDQEAETGIEIGAVSFDLDGTLLDGSPWREVIIRTCGEIAAAHPGVDVGRLVQANAEVWDSFWPQVEDQWTLGILDGQAVTLDAWRRTLRACGLEDESSAVHAAETYTRNRRGTLRLFDDVRPTFNTLRPRALALVTNGASDTQRDVLRVLGIEPEFAGVVISGEVGVAKPDAAIFGYVLENLGVPPAEVWHIGDSLTTDVAGAQNAGLTAVWLNRTGVRRNDGDPLPDHEIRSLRDLPALLSRGPRTLSAGARTHPANDVE